VAPPALIDWPATSLLKKSLKRDRKKERVGMEPASVSHRGEATGCNESLEVRYAEN